MIGVFAKKKQLFRIPVLSDYLNIHRHLSLQMVTSDGKL